MKQLKEFFDFTRDTEKKIFISLAGLLFILMPILSLNSGISADEHKYHYPHGENVYQYYKTLGKDRSCLAPHKDGAPLHMYGAVFDLSTVMVIKIIKPHDEYQVRHVMNSMAGWTAILFAALIAVMLGGWRAGIITLLLMFLSPRFLGHSFNNPKDIPFTAAYIFTIWGAIRFIRAFDQQDLLKKPLKLLNYAWPISLGIGLAIGVRVGGLLLAFYFLAFTGIWYIFKFNYKKWLKKDNLIYYGKMLSVAVLIALLGYIIGVLLWPFAHEKPIAHTKEALSAMEEYAINLRQIFEGKMLWSNNMPWYYLPKFILISIPEVVIGGFISLFILLNEWKKENRAIYVILLFVLIFPVFYIIYKESNLYGGWRHVMFVYPAMAVLASVGIQKLLDKFWKQKYYRWGILGVLVILLAIPFKHIIANHPHEYVYYNGLAGGIKKTYGEYEMDYFYHSQKAAADWLIENRIKNAELKDGEKIKVAMYQSMPYYFRDYKDKVKVIYVKYNDRGGKDWDYYIMTSSYIPPHQLKNKLWPTKNAIHTIDINGKIICGVFERQNRFDLEGTKMMRQNLIEAVRLFKKAIEADPDYDYARIKIMETYHYLTEYFINQQNMFLKQNAGQPGVIAYAENYFKPSINAYSDSARLACINTLQLYPDHPSALNVKAKLFYREGNTQEAMRIMLKNMEVNPRNVVSYVDMARVKYDQGNYQQALEYLEQANQINPDYNPILQLAIEIREKQGWQEEANRLRSLLNSRAGQ